MLFIPCFSETPCFYFLSIVITSVKSCRLSSSAPAVFFFFTHLEETHPVWPLLWRLRGKTGRFHYDCFNCSVFLLPRSVSISHTLFPSLFSFFFHLPFFSPPYRHSLSNTHTLPFSSVYWVKTRHAKHLLKHFCLGYDLTIIKLVIHHIMALCVNTE